MDATVIDDGKVLLTAKGTSCLVVQRSRPGTVAPLARIDFDDPSYQCSQAVSGLSVHGVKRATAMKTASDIFSTAEKEV